MLSEPGFWLIVAGALLVMIGFVGFAFSQMGNDNNTNGGQQPSIRREPLNPTSNGK